MSYSNIVLVGFMGTGKTVVGKAVAEEVGMTFLDMDVVIEEREGRKISDIFAEDGEPYFRSLERKLIQELSDGSGLVIATGGGIVLNPENISDFNKSSLVVCLSLDPDIIMQRLLSDTTRPLLQGDDKTIWVWQDRKSWTDRPGSNFTIEQVPKGIETIEVHTYEGPKARIQVKGQTRIQIKDLAPEQTYMFVGHHVPRRAPLP